MIEAVIEHPKRFVSFSPNIELGHVLTMVSMLTVAVLFAANFDKRISVLENAAILKAAQDAEKDSYMRSTLLEFKTDMKELQKSINSLQRTDSLQCTANNILGIRK